MALYWKGPFNVLVPQDCRVVPAADGNCEYRGGGQTEVYFEPLMHMTEDEYHKKFCQQGSDGKWYLVYSPACDACCFAGYDARMSLCRI